MEKEIKVFFAQTDDNLFEESIKILRNKSIKVSYFQDSSSKIIDEIYSQTPDFVVVDIDSKKIDAMHVINSVNASSMENKPKFIAISAVRNQPLQQKLIQSGVFYCVDKPIAPQILCERILTFASVEYAEFECKQLQTENVDVEAMVTEIIHEIGIPAHIKGYHYLRKGIVLSIDREEYLHAVTKELYPDIAKHFKTKPSRVERAIRHSIEVAWDRGDVEVLNRIFGYTINNSRGKPTNSEFIAMISDIMRLKLKKMI